MLTPDAYHGQPDYVVALDSEAWATLYLSSTDLEKAVATGEVKLANGDQSAVGSILDLFDKFAPTRNYKIPPLED